MRFSWVKVPKKFVYGTLDQLFSSFTNLILSLRFIRESEVVATSYSTIFLIYMISLGLLRSISTELIASGRRSKSDLQILNISIQIFFISVFVIFIGLALVPSKETAFLIYLVMIPFGLLLELMRNWYVAIKKTRVALRISSSQFALVAIGNVISIFFDALVILPLSWALIGILVCIKHANSLDLENVSREVLKSIKKFKPNSYTAEFLMSSGVNQILVIILTVSAFPNLSLIHRVMTTLLGPWAAFYQGFSMTLIPYVPNLKFNRRLLAQIYLTLLLWITQVPIIAILFIKDGQLAQLIVGENWLLMSDHKLAFAFYYLAFAMAGVPSIFIRGNRLVKAGLAVRMIGSFSQIIAAMVCITFFGISGFIVGLAIVNVFVTIAATWKLRIQ